MIFEQGDIPSAAARVQEIMAMPGGPETVGQVAEFLYGAGRPDNTSAQELPQSAVPTLTAVPVPDRAGEGDGEAPA